MCNLLRSDARRLVHGKMLWVVAAILVGWVCLSAYLTWVAIDALGADFIGDVDSSLIDMATGMLSQSMDLTAQFGETLVSGGGILVMLVSILAALYAVADFDTGFVKAIFPSRRGRAGYFAQKFVLFGLIVALFVALGAVALYAALRVAGFGFAPLDWGAVLQWFAVVWLLLSGYAFLAAALAWLARSKALGCVMAVLLGTSALGGILTGIVLVLPDSPTADALQAALEWLPFRALAAVGPGISAFDPNAVIEATGLSSMLGAVLSGAGGDVEPATWPGTDMLTITHVCITAAGMWLVAFLAAFVAARRDV